MAAEEDDARGQSNKSKQRSKRHRDLNRYRRITNFELLEDRQLLATVSGSVYDDLNGNGQRDISPVDGQGAYYLFDDEVAYEWELQIEGGTFVAPDKSISKSGTSSFQVSFDDDPNTQSWVWLEWQRSSYFN